MSVRSWMMPMPLHSVGNNDEGGKQKNREYTFDQA